MEDIKQEMIAEARTKHGNIKPVSGKSCLSDCFTQPMPGKLVLWFYYEAGYGNTSGIIYRNI